MGGCSSRARGGLCDQWVCGRCRTVLPWCCVGNLHRLAVCLYSSTSPATHSPWRTARRGWERWVGELSRLSRACRQSLRWQSFFSAWCSGQRYSTQPRVLSRSTRRSTGRSALCASSLGPTHVFFLARAFSHGIRRGPPAVSVQRDPQARKALRAHPAPLAQQVRGDPRAIRAIRAIWARRAWLAQRDLRVPQAQPEPPGRSALRDRMARKARRGSGATPASPQTSWQASSRILPTPRRPSQRFSSA